MKKYLILAASALLLAACSEKPGYEINGTVANTDLNGKYVYLYEYGVQDAAPMDSALVQNGTFTFKGTQNAPALRKLAFAEDVVEPKRAASGENAPFTSIFVLENGKLQAILDEAAQNEIIAKADSAFKAVPNIDKLMAHLDVLKTVAVGKKFVDFEMADPNGKTHKLSEFVGNGKNIVLIDFWASWCPPCRRDMPNLVAAYKKYKNKGFEIVGISLDSKADAWAKGVKDLNITWPQLSDLQGWKNSGAQLYGVNSIPHTVLVDKDGTIIAKNLHGEEIDAKLQEILK